MILSSDSSTSLLKIFNIAMRESAPLIFPTDTIYGIGAFADNIEANKKIFDIKKRRYDKPFPLLISSIDMLKKYAEDINDEILSYLNSDIPTTVVVKVNNRLDRLFMKDNSVAFRIPKTRWLRELISAYRYPLTATSVNESGSEFLNDFPKIVDTFSERVSFFIEGSVQESASRIVDLTHGKVNEIRLG